MGACCEKPMEDLISIRIDELWMDTIQHARSLCPNNIWNPAIRVMSGKRHINITGNAAAIAAAPKDMTTTCGASFIFHDPPFKLPLKPTAEKPFKFDFANAPNYCAELAVIEYIPKAEAGAPAEEKQKPQVMEGIRYVDVMYIPDGKKVGVLILSIAKLSPDAFPPPSRPAMGGFIRKDHWTNFTVKVGGGQGFQFLGSSAAASGGESKDVVNYTAYSSLTSGGGESGDPSATPRWNVETEPGTDATPAFNKTHTFNKLRSTPRALDLHFEATRKFGKSGERNRGLCRIDLKDPIGWTKAGPVLFPVVPYNSFSHPNARVDLNYSDSLRKPGRVCLVDIPDDDNRTDFSIERSGFSCLHEPSNKLSMFVDSAQMEVIRANMPPAEQARSLEKENAFISSIEAFFIDIGEDKPGSASAAPPPPKPVAVAAAADSAAGKNDMEGIVLQENKQPASNNPSIELARKIRAHPRLKTIPIFALINPGRQLNLGSESPFTIPPLKKPLKDEDVKFILSRFCYNMGLITVTMSIDFVPMTEDEKKAESQRPSNSFDMESGVMSKRASIDKRAADDAARELNEQKAKLADDLRRQAIEDEARSKKEAEDKAKADEEAAARRIKEEEELKAAAKAYKEGLRKGKGDGENSAVPEDGDRKERDERDDADSKVVELVDTKEAMAKAWKKKAALALYKLNHVEKANEHAAANQSTAQSGPKSTEPLKLDVSVRTVTLNYAVPPSSKLVYVVSVGNSIKDSYPPISVGDEGMLPHEPINFEEPAPGTTTPPAPLSVEVKFKEKKPPKPAALLAAAGGQAVKKKPQPTILTISVFCYPADEEQYSAADLVGQFVCGETGSSGLTAPDLLQVTAFWRSIEGKADTKRVALYTVGKNGQAKATGVMEFTACLHVKKPPAGTAGTASTSEETDSKFAAPSNPNADVAGAISLSVENQNRIVADKADEEKRKTAEAERLKDFAQGHTMTKHSFTTDPVRITLFYKPSDKLNPLGSIYWCDVDTKESDREHPSRRMGIHRIQEMLHAKFKGPLPLPDDPLRCFAIVSADGTINLEANSPAQAEEWMSTIERILQAANYVSSKT